jgi:hypothetical protein
MNKLRLRLLLLCFTLLSSIKHVGAEIKFDINQWDLIEGAQLQQKEDQQSIILTRGKMTYKAESMQDGIVEFDMYSEGHRAFVYVYFREISDQESEVVYLRTHKSNAPDTVQYAPVYQGRSAWQLHHGAKGTSTAELLTNKWIPIKIEFRGALLRVWVGEHPEPVMEHVRLKRSPVAGGITIRGNIPRASQADYSAYIKNIRITPLPVSQFESSVERDSKLSLIQQVNLSPVFAAKKQPILELPTFLDDKLWTAIEAESDGVFELLRWRKIPNGMKSWATLATFSLDSPKEQTCALSLGFSDAITLHLNKKPIVFADASYRYSQNRQEGLLHEEQMLVFLPLIQGTNTVTAAIADSFGGWGLQASLGACEGITINKDYK